MPKLNFNQLTDSGKLRFCYEKLKESKLHYEKVSIANTINELKERIRVKKEVEKLK